MFWAEMWKISEFFIRKFPVFEVKFSIHLNRRVFVMNNFGGTVQSAPSLSTCRTFSLVDSRQKSFENNVDPDETAHNEPAYQELHCLPACSWFTTVSLLGAMAVSKHRDSSITVSRHWDERVYLRNPRFKGLIPMALFKFPLLALRLYHLAWQRKRTNRTYYQQWLIGRLWLFDILIGVIVINGVNLCGGL